MPIYEYKAFGPGGALTAGVVDADTEREARQKLRRDDLLVSQLRELRSGRHARTAALSGKAPGLLTRIKQARASHSGPGARETDIVAAVTRQLAVLLASGIALAEALRAIIEQSEQRRVETMFREIRERIQQGASLADALEEHPGWFSELYCNMVRAGQAAGNLDIVLTRLADYLQAQRGLRRKVVGALTYPLLMISIGVFVVSVLMAFVVPRITTMLEDQGQTLPGPTQVLVSTSALFKQYWWVGMLVVAGVSFVIERIYRKNGAGRLQIDRFLLRVPVLGDLLRKASVARFTRTLSTLLRSGVTVIQGLEITEKVVGNRVVADATAHIRERVVEGTDIATPLKASGAFPAVVGYMVAVGEQTGELEQMLDRIAIAYDEEIDAATERLTTLLEPLMIVFLAAVVGYIVYSIVLPILKVGQFQ
jgi:general secretion pathway protein F